MPKNEQQNFFEGCRQLFAKSSNLTEIVSKYKIKPDGVYMLHRDKQGNILQEQMITHKPLLLTAFYHEAEADITYVQLELYHGRCWQKLPLKTLEEISRTNSIITLANNNADINITNARLVIEYLSCLRSCLQDALPQQKLCRYLGWEGKRFFFPGRDLTNTMFRLSDSELYSSIARAEGSWQDWLNTYDQLCSESMEGRFIVACALAAPLLKQVGFKGSPLVLLYGRKGSGKSTIMRFAASVWGSEEFIYPCNGTLNGFELRAKMLNGLPFFLDDVQLMRSRADFNEFMQGFIYMMFNGYGKQRATKELESASLNRWQTVNILSSETTVLTPEFYGGAGRRLLEVRLPQALPRELISECNKTSSNCHGLAGRKMLGLLERFSTEIWQEQYEQVCNRLFDLDDGRHESTQIMILGLVMLADALFGLLRADKKNLDELPSMLADSEQMLVVVMKELENPELIEGGEYFYEQLVDIVSANYDCFGFLDEDSGKVVGGNGYKSYGFFHDNYVYINSKVFNDFLKQFSKSGKSIKSLLRDAKLIEADEGRFTKQLNLTFNNCYRPRMVCMKYGERKSA